MSKLYIALNKQKTKLNLDLHVVSAFCNCKKKCTCLFVGCLLIHLFVFYSALTTAQTPKYIWTHLKISMDVFLMIKKR